MYLATAAVILLLTNAAYVHADCAVKPDATTGAIVIPAAWTKIRDSVSSHLFPIWTFKNQIWILNRTLYFSNDK